MEKGKAQIEMTFDVDADGILTVTAKELTSNQKAQTARAEPLTLALALALALTLAQSLEPRPSPSPSPDQASPWLL